MEEAKRKTEEAKKKKKIRYGEASIEIFGQISKDGMVIE